MASVTGAARSEFKIVFCDLFSCCRRVFGCVGFASLLAVVLVIFCLGPWLRREKRQVRLVLLFHVCGA